ICPLLSSFYTYPPPPEISPLSLHDALPIYSATLALRTQQILAYETGVARVADPLGGSYYVEALTDQVEARVVEIMEDLERRGGMVQAIEDGYLQRLISDEAFRVQKAVAAAERTIVGVNRFQTDEDPPEVEGYELDEKGRA